MTLLRLLAGLALILGWAAAGALAAETDQAPSTEGKIAEARRLHLTNSTRSRQLSEEALGEARTASDRRLEAAALIELAVALRRQNSNRIATQRIDEALKICETLGDRPLLRRAVKEAGQTYWALADSATAIGHFQRALRMAEQDADIGGQADAHAGLGATAVDLHNLEVAARHMKTALELAEQAGEPRRIALYSSNYGNRLFEAKEYPAARAAYERSLAIFRDLGQRTDADDSRVLLARVDRAEGKLASAERILKEVLPARRKLRGRIKLTTTLVDLAEVQRLQGKYDEAQTLLKEASGYAEELATPSKIGVLDAFATLYESQKDYPAALAALRARQAEAEKLFGEAAQTRAAEYREAFAAERREAEIARLQQAEKSRRAELSVKEAQVARQAAELRANRAEIEQNQASRLTLAIALGSGLAVLAAIAAIYAIRLRAERRIHAETVAAKETAEQADRVKTRFLGVASHDIRGPLGNIVSLTASLRANAANLEMTHERCDMIGSEAQRVLTLVEDLITTAALESGKLELRPVPADLADIARSAIEGMRWQTEVKRQKIVFTAPPRGTGRIVADPARLSQVIANLLGNAIKFSPPGETIAVELTRTDAAVRLAIRDRGAGIEPKDVARLFAPFERLANHPTAGESSHGLGLSIAQEIVRKHGGNIVVESQPGEGSTFTIELPHAIPEPAPQA